MIQSLIKNPLSNAGDTRDTGSNPWVGKTPGGGNGNPLQYTCLHKLTIFRINSAKTKNIIILLTLCKCLGLLKY